MWLLLEENEHCHQYCNISGMKPWFTCVFTLIPHFSSKSDFYLFGHPTPQQPMKCLGSTFASRATAHDLGLQQSAHHIPFASWLAKSEQVIKTVKLKPLQRGSFCFSCCTWTCTLLPDVAVAILLSCGAWEFSNIWRGADDLNANLALLRPGLLPLGFSFMWANTLPESGWVGLLDTYNQNSSTNCAYGHSLFKK